MELTRKPPYTRRRLEKYLKELDRELTALEPREHVELVVGGAFVLMHELRGRLSADVDVISEGLTPPVAAAARRVAFRMGIAADWINDAAKGIQLPVE